MAKQEFEIILGSLSTPDGILKQGASYSVESSDKKALAVAMQLVANGILKKSKTVKEATPKPSSTSPKNPPAT